MKATCHASGLFVVGEKTPKKPVLRGPEKLIKGVHKLVYTDRGKKRTIYIECIDISPGIAFASDDVGPDDVSGAVVDSNLRSVLPSNFSSLIESGEVVEVWYLS